LPSHSSIVAKDMSRAKKMKNDSGVSGGTWLGNDARDFKTLTDKSRA
jgi:hypothetical protein